MIEVEGYLVFASNGAMLTSYDVWMMHDRLEEGFVHSLSDVEKIKERSANWKRKPAFAIPATYSREDGVRILTNREIKRFDF